MMFIIMYATFEYLHYHYIKSFDNIKNSTIHSAIRKNSIYNQTESEKKKRNDRY